MIGTGATHSCAETNVIEKINMLIYKNFRLPSKKQMVANGQKVRIIGQVLNTLEISHIVKDIFRLVSELKVSKILFL